MTDWSMYIMDSGSDMPDSSLVVEGHFAVEEMLREALQFVPYCEEHLDVWSPRLTTVILEAASQTDSLWRRVSLAKGHSEPDEHSRIGDYRKHFGKMLVPQWAVFFGGAAPSKIAPFLPWSSDPSQLSWWKAYNALKHDRLDNKREGTLRNAVDATAALFLAIIYSGMCDLAIAANQMLEAHSNPTIESATKLLRDVKTEACAKIESRLFAHPLGLCTSGIIGYRRLWPGCTSARFQAWWYYYSAPDRK
jgi:hypothetical protein